MKSTPSNPWLSLLAALSYYGFFSFLILLLVLTECFFSEFHRSHSWAEAWWWTFGQDPTLGIFTLVVFLFSLWQAPSALRTIRRYARRGEHHMSNLIYLMNGVPVDQLPKPPTE